MIKRIFLGRGIACFFFTAWQRVDAQSVVRGLIKDANEKAVECDNLRFTANDMFI